MRTVHNIETGEIFEVEETAEEKAADLALRKLSDDLEKARIAKEAARNAVYEKLGLTADEIAALLS